MKKTVLLYALILTMVLIPNIGMVNVHAVEGPCPYNGIHTMVSEGTAHVYNSSGTYLYMGGLYECKYCGEQFVCEGNPHSGGAIKRYSYEGEFKINTQYYSSDITAYTVRYTSRSTLSGFNFIPQS